MFWVRNIAYGEEQEVQLASSNVMGFQHSIGGEEVILNTLFKMPIIFCHWLSEILKKNVRGGSMHVVSNNSSSL